MKFSIFCLFFFLLPSTLLFGQFTADFSTGNLDAWEGDKSDFIINGNQQLQLNAPSGSTSSFLYTPVSYIDSMVWDIYLKLDFAPSTSNQLKIYLGTTAPDLATASGYYLEIGASGDQDPLELKYLDNGTSSSLAASTPGLAGTEPVELNIRISKNSSGIWQCYSTAGSIPELLFTANHNLLALSSLSSFGLQCKYTDTRRDKFFFDDISIQPIQPDVTAPKCVSLGVNDANSVTLVFDEPVDEASAQTPSNYLLTPGNTLPDIIEISQANIVLRWNVPFVSQTNYTLSIQQVQDLAGNVMIPDQKTFSYIAVEKALPYELLITEIMADPTPVIGLPAVEYLEIYNNSTRTFNLADYSIRVGAGQIALPNELINGEEYVILCDADNASFFAGLGRIIGVNNFPSLTNSGAALSIRDDNDLIIHDVSYTDAWYGDPGKSDGGWALEMINPLAICRDMDNWSAADNLLGGTPGTVNSRWNVTPDDDGPALVSLFTSGPDRLLLRFDERLDPLLMENTALYSILPATAIASTSLEDPNSVEIILAENIQVGITYQFLPFEGYDCLGNSAISGDTLLFGLTVMPEPGDVLINEILFNPASGGSRFIEIINVSDKFIDLSLLSIGRLKGGQNNIYPTGISDIMAPGQLTVLSPDPGDILFRYQVPFPERLFEASLPAWDDEADNVSILAGGVVIDSLTYSSDWHLPVIADQNGVSLERVSVASPSTLSSTWHSASSTSGYGTPTGENSQKINTNGEGEAPFSVTNRQFSPNEDGYKDFLALNFLLDSGEEIGSVWIYDLEGREITQLLSNESLGTSAIVQWDGRSADQLLADMGIYIIFIQLWDAGGNVREYQETCALVKR